MMRAKPFAGKRLPDQTAWPGRMARRSGIGRLSGEGPFYGHPGTRGTGLPLRRWRGYRRSSALMMGAGPSSLASWLARVLARVR